jgi:hypothetical protein
MSSTTRGTAHGTGDLVPSHRHRARRRSTIPSRQGRRSAAMSVPTPEESPVSGESAVAVVPYRRGPVGLGATSPTSYDRLSLRKLPQDAVNHLPGSRRDLPADNLLGRSHEIWRPRAGEVNGGTDHPVFEGHDGVVASIGGEGQLEVHVRLVLQKRDLETRPRRVCSIAEGTSWRRGPASARECG